MPAYLTPIALRRCCIKRCNKVATERLRNTDNEDIGFYCPDHALAALDEYRANHERVYR